MPSCACLQNLSTATRQRCLLALLAVFTLSNVVHWYAQRDYWKRASVPKSFRLPSINHTSTTENETSTVNNVPLEVLFWRPAEELLSGYGRLPFAIENVPFLPVAYSVKDRCRTSRLNHIFFVHTAPGNWAKRRVLRKAIGDIDMAHRHAWTTVFFIGLSQDINIQRKVVDEAERHGDVVMLPYVDTYRNLTYKYVYGMKWTMDNCRSARYVVKMDDDMVINLTKLRSYLKSITPTEKPALHCFVWVNMMVDRNTKSPWYLSRKVYRKKFFPRYCSGSTVLFDSTLMEDLYNASFLVPFMSVDDAFVTGEAAKVAAVGHVRLNRFYAIGGGKWKEVARGKYIFAQIGSEKKRVRSWQIIMRDLKEPALALLDEDSDIAAASEEREGYEMESYELEPPDEGIAAPPKNITLVSYKKAPTPLNLTVADNVIKFSALSAGSGERTEMKKSMKEPVGNGALANMTLKNSAAFVPRSERTTNNTRAHSEAGAPRTARNSRKSQGPGSSRKKKKKAR